MFRASELPYWFADHQFQLQRIIGTGGMAAVYSATVDLQSFDYAQMLAFREVPYKAGKKGRAEKREQRLNKWRVRTRSELEGMCAKHGLALPGERVAVKIALPTMTAHLERFEAEWQSLMGIRNPHVIEVYGGGIDGELHYYAMQLIEDCLSLAQLADAPLADKLSIIRQAAVGLDCLHGKGIIHRDVKPDNIICTRADDTLRARVTDLGIAKDTSRSESQALTATGQLLGTPNFMAPEQADVMAEISSAVDVYALGATLYCMCVGQMPYDGLTLMQILTELARGAEPISVIEISDGRIPQALGDLIEDMMAFDPDERLAEMSQVVLAIDAYVDSAEARALTTVATVMELPQPAVPARRKRRGPSPSKRRTRKQGEAIPRRKARSDTVLYVDGEPVDERRSQKLVAAVGLAVALIVGAFAWNSRGTPPGNAPAGSNRGSGSVAALDPEIEQAFRRARADVRASLADGEPAPARSAVRKFRLRLVGRSDADHWETQLESLEQEIASEVTRVFDRDERKLLRELDSGDRARATAILRRLERLDPKKLPPELGRRLEGLRKRVVGLAGVTARWSVDFEDEGGAYRATRSQIERVECDRSGSAWALRWQVAADTQGGLLKFRDVPKDISGIKVFRLYIRARRIVPIVEVHFLSTDGALMGAAPLANVGTSWTDRWVLISRVDKMSGWNPRDLGAIALKLPSGRDEAQLDLDDIELSPHERRR